MHRMDFLLSKRRRNRSASSSSLSPTGPTLESPTSFQLSANRTAMPELTVKAKDRFERVAAMPSMFQEEKEDEESVMMDLDRGAPADPNTVSVAHRSIDEDEPVRFRNQYFEDSFAVRGQYNSPRSRVNQDSIVVVEIKMNTMVRDNASLASDISSRMAQIYQRSESSILVSIQQEACLHFGNTPLPAYLMKVTALPGLIAPLTNFRNTILIQNALQDLCHIVPSRGVVIYNSVPEENFATNGVTAMGEIARLEQQAGDEDHGFLKSISRSMSRRLKSSSAHSNPLSLATTSSWVNAPEGQGSAPRSAKDMGSQSNSKDDGKDRTVKKSRSIRQFIARGLSELGALGPPGGMPIVIHDPAEKQDMKVEQEEDRKDVQP